MRKGTYSRDQVLRVRHAIAAALPGCEFSESDYGFGLSVVNAERTKAAILFQTEYDVSEDGAVITPKASYGVTVADVPRIVSELSP